MSLSWLLLLGQHPFGNMEVWGLSENVQQAELNAEVEEAAARLWL